MIRRFKAPLFAALSTLAVPGFMSVALADHQQGQDDQNVDQTIGQGDFDQSDNVNQSGDVQQSDAVQQSDNVGQNVDQSGPNVLIVRVPNISHQQQSSSQQQFDQQQSNPVQQAQIIPVRVHIQQDANGHVNTQSVIQQADQAMQQADRFDLQAGQHDANAPVAVQQVFDQADQSSGNKALAWRFYLPWRTGGFYGYSMSPYWGYNSYYPNYFPSYGYYMNGSLYPYSYGFYRYMPGYDYHYYWRW